MNKKDQSDFDEVSQNQTFFILPHFGSHFYFLFVSITEMREIRQR